MVDDLEVADGAKLCLPSADTVLTKPMGLGAILETRKV